MINKLHLPTSNLEFTGERYIPGEANGDIELEHHHRYLLARNVVTGKVVLDIACGEGYGSFMLATTAAQVTGVDISQQAVDHARNKYVAKDLNFIQGSCARIPLADASVDVVVSFETIEHHTEHDAMMSEIKRVLKSDGFLVISCPDKYEYSDKPNYHNEFHVKELYRDEFVNLINRYFEKHTLYGQRVVYGSLILSEEGVGDIGSFDIDDRDFSVIAGTPQALYLIAVASDGEPAALKSGIFQQPLEQSSAVKTLASAVDELNMVIDSRNAVIDNLKLTLGQELDAYRAQSVEYARQVKSLQNEIEASQSHMAYQASELVSLNAKRSAELTSVRFLGARLIALVQERIMNKFRTN